MKVRFGKGTTEFGPGVDIFLTGCDVALAISAYLVAKDIHISGPRSIMVNGSLCKRGRVYVDPSGFVVNKGVAVSGRGAADTVEAGNSAPNKQSPKAGEA
jgi:hypothetical protein